MPLLIRYDDRDRLPLAILGDLVNGNGRQQALRFKRSGLQIGTFSARVVALMDSVVNVEEVARHRLSAHQRREHTCLSSAEGQGKSRDDQRFRLSFLRPPTHRSRWHTFACSELTENPTPRAKLELASSLLFDLFADGRALDLPQQAFLRMPLKRTESLPAAPCHSDPGLCLHIAPSLGDVGNPFRVREAVPLGGGKQDHHSGSEGPAGR